MKKLLNDPERFVPDMLRGLLAAHPADLTAGGGDLHCVVRTGAPRAGKVALVTGGGSGHLPVFLGYVGDGLLDGCAVGEVFASPSAARMLQVMRAVDGGAGVLQIFGNYNGDRMNFEMAAEMAEAEGMRVRAVRVADDVQSATRAEAQRRRGVAGLVFAFKVAGAAAAQGASLDEVEAITRRAVAGLRSLGVGLSPCTVPAVGRPTFEIGDGEMEMGIGIHGERGMAREPLARADEVADRLTAAVCDDLETRPGDRVAVMVNGLGATPSEELYVLYGRVHERLRERGVRVHRAYVGEYATSMEMAGASVTLLRLDDELAGLIDRPARSPFFVQVQT